MVRNMDPDSERHLCTYHIAPFRDSLNETLEYQPILECALRFYPLKVSELSSAVQPNECFAGQTCKKPSTKHIVKLCVAVLIT